MIEADENLNRGPQRKQLGTVEGRGDLRRTITSAMIARAKRMLAKRYTVSEVARELGIDLKTVQRIEAGTLTEEHRRYERCQTCGNLMLMPCRLCEVRRFKVQSSKFKV